MDLPRGKLLLALVPILILWPATSQQMSQYMAAFFPPDEDHLVLMSHMTSWDSSFRAAVVIGQIALVPALFEELLFRGLLLSALRRLTGDWPAVLIVGVSFAAALPPK